MKHYTTKHIHFILALFIALVLLAGCGAGQQRGSRGGYVASPGEPGSAPEAVAMESSGSFGSAQDAVAPTAKSSSAPSADFGSGESLEPEPEASPSERPGLGTSWGETRVSRVSTAPFVREDPHHPFTVMQLFYNDEDGVQAMARRAGIGRFDDDGFTTFRRAVTVRLLDSSGRPLPGIHSGGRRYVVGEDGERYIIQIRNHTSERIEAVATVDGLDVVDGRAGSFEKRGYILNPHSTVEIDGFRRSLNTVAAFRFGSVRDSYAARKGEDRNVGVIGVALFEEHGHPFPWTDEEIDRRHDADPFPARFADPPPDGW